MARIQVLDQITIDKIAAGEVVERPASVVKELVENALDAGSTQIVVEIEEGGISLIRISDNGCGIDREDIPKAFLRHSTSKIRSVEDLTHVSSLGFRGEALSSISAVAKVEMITKRAEDMLGTRYVIEGGQKISMEDAGAPNGTTLMIRQIFYNVPARRKFLKTPMTEASHIQDLLIRLALSHPSVSFRFLNNGQEKLRTSGNGKVKDVIYAVYGREAAMSLLDMDYNRGGLHITGYVGKPEISRGNRNFENYFINGRYMKNAMVSKAIEDAYKDYSMQHRFPFVVLYLHLNQEEIDVNVHPAKMDLRFYKQQEVYNTIYEGIRTTLKEPELIPKVSVPDVPKDVTTAAPLKQETYKAEPVKEVKEKEVLPEVQDEEYFLQKMRQRVMDAYQKKSDKSVKPVPKYQPAEAKQPEYQPIDEKQPEEKRQADCIKETAVYQEETQLSFFEERLLDREKKSEYTIVGQVFQTYWIVELDSQMYIIDQHAAHERVLYEKTIAAMKDRTYTSQMISPPIILTLSMQEEAVLKEHLDRFARIGFEIEPFGGNEYAVRAVPDNLFHVAQKKLLIEMLDEMTGGISSGMAPNLIDEKIASMSCKAAVKGNQQLSYAEMETLIGELLQLENPYHCPHGRPTIISMTKRELEKKFKRIV